LTLCAIALMIPVSRDLARIDRWAPTALGLIVGAAFGNLTSLIFSSQGVVDFIAVRTGDASALVLNVADIAAYVGLGMLVRTAFLLVDRIRQDIPLAPTLAVDAPRLTLVHLEREVPIPLAAGGVSDRTAIDVPTQDRLKRLPPAASVRRFHDLVADAPARSDEFTL
ncbi:MAG: signal peptidase II, partial [Gemmatimonadaceae bacterium]